MELLDLLYNYTSNYQLFDFETVKTICNIIKEKNKLDINYEINNDNKSSVLYEHNNLGEYDLEKTIYIFYQEIINCINKGTFKKMYYDNYRLSPIETIMVNNINILETIIHETEHAKQIALIKNSNIDTVERTLYQYEYDFMAPDYDYSETSFIKYHYNIFKKYIIYSLNYNISFMERMANINSKEEIISLLKEFGNEFKSVLNIEKNILDYFMYEGYKYNINGPTNTFIYKIGASKDFREHGYYKIVQDMNFDTRYRYGFQLTDNEYKKIRFK